MASTRTTIKDVAREAGVSITTVSHALNGKGSVNPDTVARVRQIAGRLGYRPSGTARALQRGASGAIALFLPHDERMEAAREISMIDYYMKVAATAAAAAFERERPLVLPPILRSVQDWQRLAPEGVLIVDPADREPAIDLLVEAHIPVVTIERDGARPEWSHYVGSDNATSTDLVLDHLHSQGARRIALLTPDWSRAWTAEIKDAYLSWCAQHSLVPQVVEVPAKIEHRDAYVDARAVLASDQRPEAIYAPADGYAAGIMRACGDLGLSVPGDLLLVGGGNTDRGDGQASGITMVDLEPVARTEAAIAMLVDLIEGRPVTGPQLVPNRLLLRTSSTGLSRR